MNTSLHIPALRVALCVAVGALAPAAFAQLTLQTLASGSGFSNAAGTSNYNIDNNGNPDVATWGTGVANGLGSNVLELNRVTPSFVLPTNGSLAKVGTLTYTNTHTTGGVITAIDYNLRLDIIAPATNTNVDFKFTLSIDTTQDPNSSGPTVADKIKWNSSLDSQLINVAGTNYLFSFSFADSNGSFLETEGTQYAVDESYYSNNRGGYSYDCGGSYQTPVWGKDSADIFVSVVKPTGTPNTGAVPEPSTYGLLGACAALALITVRRATRK